MRSNGGRFIGKIGDQDQDQDEAFDNEQSFLDQHREGDHREVVKSDVISNTSVQSVT